jgi:hypothetical protein
MPAVPERVYRLCYLAVANLAVLHLGANLVTRLATNLATTGAGNRSLKQGVAVFYFFRFAFLLRQGPCLSSGDG